MAKNRKRDGDKKAEGNIYDRIFRENAQNIFIPLIRDKLGIEIQSYQKLETKFSKTLEREVDFLYQIINNKGEKTTLHLEFQTNNNPEMLARMQEYHGLIYRKLKLPIRHIVIFVGKGKSKMPATLKENLIFKGFDTINLSDLNPRELLRSQIPEMIIMALLGDLKEERIETILQLITERLQKVSDSEETTRRYLNQLLILSRIRNLENQTTKYLKDMPITYDINKDSLYKQGIQQGIERGIEQENKNTILKMSKAGISPKQIATILEIDLSYAEEIIKKEGREL